MVQRWLNDLSRMEKRKWNMPRAPRAGHEPVFEDGRTGIMLPLEMYWPPEMLARVFPEKYRHLAQPKANACTKPTRQQRIGSCYRVERRGSCTVVWLGKQ